MKNNKLRSNVISLVLIIISGVFIGLYNVNSNATTIPTKKKIKFTPKEDKMLVELFNKYGKDWAKIAQYMPNRDRKQCRERYVNYLGPSLDNNKSWTEEEDKLLVEKQGEFGNRWAMMTNYFPGKSELQLSNRYISLRRAGKIELFK